MAASATPSRRDLLTGRIGDPEASEAHVSSLVVHVRAEELQGFGEALAQIPGAEIHAEQGGKFVVTLETASEAEIVTRLNEISLLSGVLSAALIFHQVETDPSASPIAQG